MNVTNMDDTILNATSESFQASSGDDPIVAFILIGFLAVGFFVGIGAYALFSKIRDHSRSKDLEDKLERLTIQYQQAQQDINELHLQIAHNKGIRDAQKADVEPYADQLKKFETAIGAGLDKLDAKIALLQSNDAQIKTLTDAVTNVLLKGDHKESKRGGIQPMLKL